jgi:enoyl-CoA hydratase
MIMTGRMMDAEEALSTGLVSKVVPQEDLVDAVKETAEQVLTKGPLAVRLAKLAVQPGYETDHRTGLLIERLAQAILLTSEHTREGTSTFLEKREPDFKGR